MKKIITITLCIIALNVQGQIILEKVYTAYGVFPQKISETEMVYPVPKYSSIELYDAEHQLIKTIPHTFPDVSVMYVSRVLFDYDNDFELLISANGEAKVIEEDGSVIFSESGTGFVWLTTTGPKLIIMDYTTESTRVYSLPGTIYQSVTEQEERTDNRAFPNPAGDYVVLQGLKTGEIIQIFDISGSLIAKYISTGEGSMKIPLFQFNPGCYIYKTNTQTGKFAVN